MPTAYTDQALGGNFDPGAPGALPTTATVIGLTLLDSDDDGFIEANGADQVNGSNVTNVWEGDTVTIDGVTITGTTFYTADGSRYFTPTDGSVLTPGTITSTTFVTTSTQFDVIDLGPPCFAAGTLIATPDGPRMIEDISCGDLVLTRDQGAQPVRWKGQRRVSGRSKFAPVRIRKGALGNTRDLRVSPQHRMLVSDWRAQYFLGEETVFCPAVQLINGDTIHCDPCDQVTYVHLMFDQHEVIYAEGAESESFLVGDMHCAEGSATRREILEIFPELESADKLFVAAHPVARWFEARVITHL